MLVVLSVRAIILLPSITKTVAMSPVLRRIPVVLSVIPIMDIIWITILIRWTKGTYRWLLQKKGIDYKIKTIQVGNKTVKLQVWDTAGQERFRTITKTYYTNSQAIMLIYSVTDQKSFLNIQNWIQQIQANTQNKICKIIVGNKCDVKPEERKVSYEEGKKLAEDFGLDFFEVSAKNDTNVDDCFLKLTELTLESWGDKVKVINRKKRSTSVLSNKSTGKKDKDKCCLK